jgi:ribosome modulation factor
MADALELPRNIESWNPAMRGAYKKGRNARLAGEPIEACPYKDKRKGDGRLSWSRAFISAWRDGWQDAEKTA